MLVPEKNPVASRLVLRNLGATEASDEVPPHVASRFSQVHLAGIGPRMSPTDPRTNASARRPREDTLEPQRLTKQLRSRVAVSDLLFDVLGLDKLKPLSL